MTIAQQALEMLNTLTPDELITHKYTNKVDKCCIMGHWLRIHSDDPKDYSIENCCRERYNMSTLRGVSVQYFINVFKIPGRYYDISTINNQPTKYYPQDTPYERVKALLTDMVAAGY